MKKWLISLLLVTLLAAAAIADLTTTQSTTSGTTSATQTMTAADYISAGKNNLHLHQILAARDQFKQAVALDANNQEANFLYGVTRVFAVYEDSQTSTSGLDSIKEIFELSGFTFDAFGLYNTTVSQETSTLPGTTPTTGAVQDYLKTRILPEVEGAIGNLAKVSSTGFSSAVDPSYLNQAGTNLSADYADALVVKSLLYALQANIHLMLAYNMNVNLPDIQGAADQLGTYKELLTNDATLLTVKDATKLGTAKTALLNFINTYSSAVPVLKARAGSPYHLFVVDTETTDEPVGVGSSDLDDIGNTLTELKASLSGPHTFNSGSNNSLTVDASKFFSATAPINLRAELGNCSTGSAFPDQYFGGVLPQSFPGYSDLVAKVGPHLLGVVCTDSKYEMPLMELGSNFVYLSKSSNYSTGPLPVTISNHGTGTLNVSSITLTGSNLADFVLTGGTCGSTAPTLAPGTSCSVNVDLNSSSTNYGNLFAAVTLNSNDLDNPSTTVGVMGYTQAPPGGAITGHVKDAVSHAGLSGVSVYAYDPTYGYQAGYTVTDVNGAYTLTGLPCGTYKIQYNYSGSVYAQQWYNNKNDLSSADAVTLGTSNLSLGDTFLAPAGSITGYVKDAVSHSGLAGVYVYAYDSTYGYQASFAVTDSNGAYTLTGIPCGTYKIEYLYYGSSYAQQWYNNKNDLSTADPVSLGAADVALGDTLLSQGGSIAGRVTDTSGNAAAWCYVYLYTKSGDYLSGAWTDGNGYYTASGLATGSYKIQFDGSPQGLASQFYGGVADIGYAATVAVTAPATTANINMVLASAGSISGHVTDSSGNPISYATVYAYQAGSATPYTSTYVYYDGTYSFSSLPTGSYKLQFVADSQYAQKFYNGKQDLASADAVTVTSGADTGNIDIVLGPAAITLIWGNVYHVTKGDGTQVDQLDAGINSYAGTLDGMNLTVTGPNGFTYTFSDADLTPYLPGKGLAVSKTYTALAPGVYTYTLTDANGNVSHRVLNHLAVAKGIPQLDPSTIAFKRNQDGSYRISWAPVNDAQTYFYRVRVVTGDTNMTPFFISPLNAAAYADLPTSLISTGFPYKVRVEAFDAISGGVANNRGDSPYVDFVPQFADYDSRRVLLYPYAFNVVDNGSKTYLFGFTVGSQDASQVSAASVTGPNGFSYTYQLPADRSGSDFFKNAATFNVTPAPGLYTFNVTANGVSHTAYATLTAAPATPYAAPDSSTYQAADLGNGKIRFSWANVNHTGALYYRVTVTDTSTGLNVYSARANQTFADIPKTALGDLGTKKFRAEVCDSADATTQRNRSNGGWSAAPFPVQAYDAANPAIKNFALRNQRSSDGRDYTQIAVNASVASSTMASMVVTGPNGYSRDLLVSGRYSPSLGGYTLEEPGSFAPGLYTLKVKDNFGRTATGYFYKPAVHSVPQVDYRSFFLDEEADGALRLSWAPVASDVPLWYEVSLYDSSDTDGDRLAQRTAVLQNYANVSGASVYPLASVTMPSTLLANNSYVVVRAYDGSSASTVDNFSSSAAAGFTGKVGADYASLADADQDGFAGDVDANDADPAVYPYAGGNDSLAPRVVATAPAANATGAARDGVISVTFNKVIDQRTLPASFTLNNGVTGSISYDPDGMTASFLPTTPLQSGTRYTASVSTALKDQGGKSLGSAYSWSFTTDGVPPSYNVNTTITGSGAINGLAPGASYSCASGVCSASYAPGTQLVLHPSPSAGYQFTGWSGACASFGTGDCTLNLNQDSSVGATFNVIPNVRIGGNYYPKLEDAFSAAVNGDLIQSQAIVFTSTGLVFNRPGVTLKLWGGYESTFAANNGFTVIDGKLLLDAGTLKVQKLKIK